MKSFYFPLTLLFIPTIVSFFFFSHSLDWLREPLMKKTKYTNNILTKSTIHTILLFWDYTGKLIDFIQRKNGKSLQNIRFPFYRRLSLLVFFYMQRMFKSMKRKWDLFRTRQTHASACLLERVWNLLSAFCLNR